MTISQAERAAFQLDPCLPAHPDPYPIYAALRQESPVQWCEGPGLWVVLGHPETEAHMRDPRCLRQSHLDKLIARFGDGRIFARQKLDVPYLDGEEHVRVRQHMLNAFHGIDMQAVTEVCTAFIQQRLDALPPGTWFDLMPQLARPLPVVATSHLMGVPPDQQTEVLQHVSRFVRARGLTHTDETTRDGDEAMAVYRRFFLPLMEQRRRHPQVDVLSRLLSDSPQGIPLSDEQLLLFVASNFYSASIYTVPLLLSSMALVLARQPQLFQALRQAPEKLNRAVEEMLRFDPPAQALNPGAVSEAIELGGRLIPAGASITALVGAANRDPRVFTDPDRCRLDRDPNPHLSFAPGLHQCLGLQLARLEIRAVLRVWLERFARIEVDEASSARLCADRFRGFERLMVRFS